MTNLEIRRAQPNEYTDLGRLLVEAYLALPGMPRAGEQPDYYSRLGDVAGRAADPAIEIWIAIANGEVLGTVDFITDMRRYRSGSDTSCVPDAAGIRLLAVVPVARGQGIGKALTGFCVARARGLGKAKVILHTTKAMATAWAMYERLGFRRCAELDFRQEALEVFGFVLVLSRTSVSH